MSEDTLGVGLVSPPVDSRVRSARRTLIIGCFGLSATLHGLLVCAGQNFVFGYATISTPVLFGIGLYTTITSTIALWKTEE